MVTRGCLAMLAATGIAAGALLAVATTSRALAAGPPVVVVPDRHFDHARHAASANARGKTAGCADCHDDNKRTEHARCAGCHSYPSSCSVMKTTGPGGPARLCQTCHKATRQACLPGDLPPLPTTNSFVPTFAHAKHLGLGASIEQDCGLCHKAQVLQPTTAKPHALCSGCHSPNGARPPMGDCAGCHVAPTGKSTTAAAGDAFRLAGFDHRAHAQASQAQTPSCTSCHDKPVGDVPKPSMIGCQTRCHDGQKAFSATGTHCTLCHRAPATAPPAAAARTDLPFSHVEHAKRNVKIDDCTACHVLDNDGTLAAPLSRKDHQPCANSGCHQTEYLTRTPKICGVCHDAALPWAKAAARPEKRPGVDWFETMNHASHITGARASCEGCHGDKRAGAEAPHGHRACATCHGRGQAPAMTNCGGCHTRTRLSKMAVSVWNVSATFEHTKHAVDPRSRKPTACTECHTTVAAAKDMSAVAPPRMADCEGCHDGKIEFKTTGFGCARCHGPKVQAAQAAVPPIQTALFEPRSRSW